MMTVIFLLVLGLLFIFIEFYLPGAVMGILGTILLFASLVTFIDQVDSPIASIFFGLGILAAVVILIRFTIRRIPKSKSQYSIYLKDDQEGFRAATFDKSAVGKRALVVTDLRPGGYVVIEGKKYSAISQVGYLPKGSEVIVIGGDGEDLLVKNL